jgi:hypothetical protein
MNATTTNAVKMLASFNRGIFIPLIGDNDNPQKVYSILKDKGARVTFDHVRSLMAGQEEIFKDFEVVTIIGARSLPVAGRTIVPAPQPAEKTTLMSGAPAISRGRGRQYAPSGIIKPLKRGTIYAKLMEMLVEGATMQQLLDATSNETSGGVNDVLSWTVKDRGYGLRFNSETGTYHIVMPVGHKALTYQE